MNDEQLRAALNQAAGALDLPERFQSPSQLAMTASRAPRILKTLRKVMAVAAAAAVATAGLTLTQPGRGVLAEAIRQLSWIAVDSRTLEEKMGDFKDAQPGPAPSAEILQAAAVDPVEARRQFPFVAPLTGNSFSLVSETARHLVKQGPDGQWSVDAGRLNYSQAYRLPSGEEIRVGQSFTQSPPSGTLYEMPPETSEIQILGHPAYLSTRHIVINGQGESRIVEYPMVRIFIEMPARKQWLEVGLASSFWEGKPASTEQVLQLAEAFTAHAVSALSGK